MGISVQLFGNTFGEVYRTDITPNNMYRNFLCVGLRNFLLPKVSTSQKDTNLFLELK